jgi:hypothetical protein
MCCFTQSILTLRLSVGGQTDGRTHARTHARKIFTQYSGISSCSLGNTDSTYKHSHMPKINSSSVKICESSRPRLAQKFSIVTRAVVANTGRVKNYCRHSKVVFLYYYCT